jgi:hypothetical protein
MFDATKTRSHRAAPRTRWSIVLGILLTLALAAPVAATTTTDPGRLAPTRSEPALGVALTGRMTTFWNALVRGDAARARGLFFPRSAYLRMKTGLLASPSDDFDHRLLAFFDLDVTAYHRTLVRGGQPTLVRVAFRARDAAWIAPGACENLIGYWHLPGVRFIFRHGAATWSVAVNSLISWRGVWYVIHLGPNPRASNVGTLDRLQRGAASPGPAGGC